jgi:hypothetical protein
MSNAALKKKIQEKEVQNIFGPGVYNFHVGGNPNFTHGRIVDHLVDTIKGLRVKHFIEASLRNGYTPARIETAKKKSHSSLNYTPFFLVLKDQYNSARGIDMSSNGGAWGSFDFEDIGKIKVLKNKLIQEPCDLDGKLAMSYTGTVPHFHRGGSTNLKYELEIVGDNPGDLIMRSIDFINSRLRKTRTTLYKEN